MVAVEVDGVRYEAADEKEARRLMAKAVREARKADAAREALRTQARLEADAKGFMVLANKIKGQGFPCGWRAYRVGQKWAEHLFTQLPVEYGSQRKTRVNHLNGTVVIDHYGHELLGGVCNGAGFCWCIFLQDMSQHTVAAYSIGVAGGQWALTELPGVSPEDFPHKDE